MVKRTSPQGRGATLSDEDVLSTDTLNQLLIRGPGQEKTLVSIFRRGVERVRGDLVALRDTRDILAADAIQRQLHSMRGGLGTLGAIRFSKKALSIENRLRDGGRMMESDCDALLEELDRLSDAAEAWAADALLTGKIGDRQAIAHVDVVNFRRQLMAQDIRAFAVFEELRSVLVNAMPSAEFNELDAAMGNLQFQVAGEVVTRNFPDFTTD